MPIVTIRALPQPGIEVTKTAARIGAAIAKAAGMPPSHIYVLWSDISAGHYGIAEAAPDEQPRDTHPPLVEISATSGRTPEFIEGVLAATAQAVAAELGVAPENVRVLYQEIPPRRLFSRGRYQ
jgi:phenylpyruvate tautomerase PptA (4-oxalocrotonate tautomerase family)